MGQGVSRFGKRVEKGAKLRRELRRIETELSDINIEMTPNIFYQCLTALRLARYFGSFGTSAEMWIGLQADYDLHLVRYETAGTIEREVAPRAA